MAEPQESYDSFRERLVAALPRLPRRIEDGARFVLDHPDEVLISSMRDLARRARVSPATLVRLAQALGFDGWAEIRTIHAAHLRQAPAAYAERAAQIVAREDSGALLADSFAASKANLEHTAGVNSAAEIEAAARRLAHARRVFVSAFMSCRGPGHTFTYLCRMLRDDVILLGAEGASLATELQMLSPDDAVLSINFHPYGREILEIARAVEASGAGLVALSDSRATPLTPLAREVILFAPDSPSFFPSLTAATAAIEALLVAMLAELGETARARIGRIEERLYSSGTYATPSEPARRTPRTKKD